MQGFVTVSMTETVTYDHTFTADEFAEMVHESPEGLTLEELKAYVTENEDSDYGVADADGLLDATMEHFTAVTDRSWWIDVHENETQEGE